MLKAKIILLNEVQCKFEGLDIVDRRKISNIFKFELPGARFTPSVRLGRWDGKVGFFSIGGSTFINLIPEILEHLNDKYDIDLIDNRNNINISFENVNTHSYSHLIWPPEHECAGESIILRDYQVEAINNYLNNPQAVLEISTSSGKCLTYCTKLDILITNTEFRDFLQNQLKKNNQDKKIELIQN